ncbi:hypothetical protein ABZ570_26855 [Micromonospora sp. NPDC007271]|uniref:hypothetical protein n=1 Tax=Micromonospora sp. NPDC007271 TaxID=3154587 RepID=UPI0033FBA93A
MGHEHRVFHNPPPATPADVRAALDRGELSRALDAMVGAVLYGDGDWKELQELYLGLLDHEDRQVKALAATCLGHLARVYGRMDEARVVAALRRVRSAPYVGGAAITGLEDIELFLHPRRARWRGRLWRALRPWTWF